MRRDPLAFLTTELDTLKQQGLYRHLRVLEDEQKAKTTFDHRQVVNLSSNNYLGLTTHPRLREAALEATRRFGVGSGSVRTIAGTMEIHMELERRLAEFKQTEAVVVFQSGFAANAGTVAAVLNKDDVVVSDALNHASIIDGARLSRATIKVFPHKDVDAARQVLRDLPAGQRKLLITDGVFSMDGDLGRAAGVVHARRGVRLHHDGRRCARERRVRQERTRHRRSLRHARPRGHSGRHAVEGDGRARRLRRGKPRAHRVPVSPGAAVSVLDVASAGGRRGLHRGDRCADGGAADHRPALGEYAVLQGLACKRSASTPA